MDSGEWKRGRDRVVLWEEEEPPEDTDNAEIASKRKRRRKDDPATPQQQQEGDEQSQHPPQQPGEAPTANSTAQGGHMRTTYADRLTLAAPTAATSVAAVGTARPLTAEVEAARDQRGV